MNARRVLIGVVGSAALLVAMDSMAGGVEQNDSSVLSGIYVGGNVGYGETNESFTNTDGSTVSGLNNKGFVWGVNGGYQFTKNWAVEAGYTQMPNVRADVGTLANENRIVDLVAKGIYPINGQFNVFGKLGVAYTHTRNTDLTVDNAAHSAVAPYFGAGVGYNLTQNVSVNVQGFATTKTGNTVPAMFGGTVGLQYNF